MGRVVANRWKKLNSPEIKLRFKTSKEDTGSYRVLVYPDSFSGDIDRMIYEWYFPPPIKQRENPDRERKRIPLKNNNNK